MCILTQYYTDKNIDYVLKVKKYIEILIYVHLESYMRSWHGA